MSDDERKSLVWSAAIGHVLQFLALLIGLLAIWQTGRQNADSIKQAAAKMNEQMLQRVAKLETDIGWLKRFCGGQEAMHGVPIAEPEDGAAVMPAAKQDTLESPKS